MASDYTDIGLNSTLRSENNLAVKREESGFISSVDSNTLIERSVANFPIGNMPFAVHPGPRQWTTNDSWTTINSSDFQLDGNSFANMEVYFEVLGAVEVSGRTASYRIYNVSDAVAVANTTVTITGTAAEANGWADADFAKSGRLLFSSGSKRYREYPKTEITGDDCSTEIKFHPLDAARRITHCGYEEPESTPGEIGA